MMCSDVVMCDVLAARNAATPAAPDDDDEERQLCVICLEVVTEDATFLSCAHVYHGACISRWLQRAPRCPQCGVAAGPLAAGSLDVRLQSAEAQLLAVRRTAISLVVRGLGRAFLCLSACLHTHAAAACQPACHRVRPSCSRYAAPPPLSRRPTAHVSAHVPPRQAQLLAVRRTATIALLPAHSSPCVSPCVSPRATVLGPVARGTPPHHRTLLLPPLASPRAQGCTALPHPLPTPHASPHASPHATHVPAHVSAHMPPMCQPKCEPMRHRGPSPGAAHQPARRAAPARPARAARLRRRAGPHGARCSPWPEPEP